MTHSVCEGWAGEDAWESLRAAELSHCAGKGGCSSWEAQAATQNGVQRARREGRTMSKLVIRYLYLLKTTEFL